MGENPNTGHTFDFPVDAEIVLVWYLGPEPARPEFQAIDVNFYPGGEPYIKAERSWEWDYSPTGPTCMLLRPKSLTTFTAAMYLVDALAERGGQVPWLQLPYLPGARQDRLNDGGDYLFTAKSIARDINRRGFPGVGVTDPHSDVMPALIDGCSPKHIPTLLGPDTQRLLEAGYTAVIAPDAGAAKRAGKVAGLLGVPVLQAWKTRDVNTGQISGFGVEQFHRAGTYLLVDDICDGGGTFNGLAEFMLDLNPVTLDLFVTHGIFSQGVDTLLDNFRGIFTTDSIINQPDGVDVIPFNQRFLEQST